MRSSPRLLARFSVLFMFAAASNVRAQQGSASVAPRGPRGPGVIRGRLTESVSGQAFTTGSIAVLRASDSMVVAGALANPDGTFRVVGLVAGRYTVRVRALGYLPVVRGGVVVSTEHPVVDLGTIAMSQVAVQIAGQTVTAEREEITFAPDRNVYTTSKMATASGGTAIDVLRNVPTVEVDATNQVTLRGNGGVVVQINGRSSSLSGEQLGNFLAQLPASAVKNVEVSTNPSAKNDPEGAAGIINIVLNQETELNWSGAINTGTGTTGQLNFSGNVGRQSGPLTLFLSYGLYHNHNESFGDAAQTNLAIAVPSFVNSRLVSSSQQLWQNMAFRSEYRVNRKDAFSFDALLSGGSSPRDNSAYYANLDQADTVISLFDQYSNQVSHGFSQDYTAAFRRTGDAKSTTFSTELRFTTNRNTNDGNLFGVVRQGDASTGAFAIPNENDVSTFSNRALIFQGDYTKPFGEHTKLEAGLKEIVRQTSNDFTAAYLDSTTDQYAVQPSRTTDFDYKEQIGAAYVVLSRQFGKLQTQAGLRLEEAANILLLPDAPANQQHVDNGYASAFPSGILIYSFTPMRQVKLSYSRRISRPNPFQLNPVVVKQDARDFFVGNPNLRPEYTDALEISLMETRPWGTIQLNPYLRNTSHAVRNIQTIDSTGITTSTYDNVASTVQLGTDLNVTYRHGPLTLFTGGSAWHYSSNASNLPGNLSTQTDVWGARMNASWKLTPATDLQAFANYRSAGKTEYGSQQPPVFTNAAVRHKLWGDKGSVTLRVQDPFNMMTFGSMIVNAQVVKSSFQNFGARGVFINISRSFGQELKLRPPTPESDPQPAPPSSGGTP